MRLEAGQKPMPVVNQSASCVSLRLNTGIVASAGTVAVEPVNRASGGLAVASGCRALPILAACQSPSVTPRHALALHETVRVSLEFKESFFSRGNPSPRPAGGRGKFATIIRLGVPPFERRCFLDILRHWRILAAMVFEEFAPFTRRVMDLLDDDDLADVQGLLLARPTRAR